MAAGRREARDGTAVTGGGPMGSCCRGGAKGLACGAGAVEAAGDVMVAPQFGQGPDTPAISAGTVSKMPQVWQLKWMTLSAGFMWRRTSSL